MKRVMAILFTSLALGACANSFEPGPSHLGVQQAAASEGDEELAPPAPTALKKVRSNKVLGAMAFQKVTGRPVDPSRLSND